MGSERTFDANAVPILSFRLHVPVAVAPDAQFFQSQPTYQLCLFQWQKKIRNKSCCLANNPSIYSHCLLSKICILRFNRSRGLNDLDDEVACKVYFQLNGEDYGAAIEFR